MKNKDLMDELGLSGTVYIERQVRRGWEQDTIFVAQNHSPTNHGHPAERVISLLFVLFHVCLGFSLVMGPTKQTNRKLRSHPGTCTKGTFVCETGHIKYSHIDMYYSRMHTILK